MFNMNTNYHFEIDPSNKKDVKKLD